MPERRSIVIDEENSILTYDEIEAIKVCLKCRKDECLGVDNTECPLVKKGMRKIPKSKDHKSYYKLNKENFRRWQKKYYYKNKDKILEKQKEYLKRRRKV